MKQALCDLCRQICMPEEVTDQLLSLWQTLRWDELEPAAGDLFRPETWESGLERLYPMLAEDPRGLKMLTLQLLCALKTREQYAARGIPDDIFLATMDCFPRFLGEHLESFGTYGFDREWWTVRQLSCILFRVGLLEYELREGFVSLHIPSGAKLDPAAVAASLEAGREFLARYYPDWAGKPMTCHSWLLSPTLKELLPPEANIRRFQDLFHITPTGQVDDDFLQWAFRRKDLPTEQLPENTSLQRKLKAHLLSGGTFTDARGTVVFRD